MKTQFNSNQNVGINTEKKNTVLNFIKGHKKEIAIIAGIACVAVVGVLIMKNGTAANALKIDGVAKGLNIQSNANFAKSSVTRTYPACNPSSNNPINVSEHLRNLPDGWKASQSKIDLAEQFGFSLRDHQTWVNSYTKTAG